MVPAGVLKHAFLALRGFETKGNRCRFQGSLEGLRGCSWKIRKRTRCLGGINLGGLWPSRVGSAGTWRNPKAVLHNRMGEAEYCNGADCIWILGFGAWQTCHAGGFSFVFSHHENLQGFSSDMELAEMIASHSSLYRWQFP